MACARHLKFRSIRYIVMAPLSFEVRQILSSKCFRFCIKYTTASNTGKDKGAMVRLIRLVKRALLFLACRHHISELLVKNPWEASFGKSPAPDVRMFVKFKEHWPEVDTSLVVRTVKIPSEEKKEELLNFVTSLLEKGEFI